VPLAVLLSALCGLVAIVVTVGLLAMVLRVALRALGLPDDSMLHWLVLVAMPTALILDQVRVTLVDGQIDVALMTLVVIDTIRCGLRIGERRYRGVLVGLAAAVRPTPAVFVLYFLVRASRGRQRVEPLKTRRRVPLSTGRRW